MAPAPERRFFEGTSGMLLGSDDGEIDEDLAKAAPAPAL